METAKPFWAVRLPKAFRFEGEEARIRRQRDTAILEHVLADWRWLDAVAGTWDADGTEAAAEPPTPQERPELDDLFR